ncbi:MAG: hypothetical protein IJA60_01085 [Clostridia bacterium]|nr:hypothetical protein [Clostridia bacterium]
MNIDKNMLASLANLDDKTLISSIRMIAAASGIDLSETKFEKGQLDALRTAMRGATDKDIENAKRIFEGYTKK